MGRHADDHVNGAAGGDDVVDEGLMPLSGVYREIEPPRRLVYSYVWETLPGPGTLVAIELTPCAGGTELHLVHSGFGDRELAAGHEHGWADCFQQLAVLLQPRDRTA